MARSVEEQLNALGIDRICQWDVLLFLHTHNRALASPDHIGHLLGYAANEVVVALDHLKSSGLMKRSRLSQGVRLYRFSRPPGPRGPAFDRLLASAEGRAGRLKLIEALHRTRPQSKSKEHSRRSAQPGLRWVRVA